MRDDTRYILDSLLADWHCWAKSYSATGTHSTAPMFNGLVPSRQWDSESDVIDTDLRHDQLKAVDFHISELEPTHRTAIGIHARNLVTGKSVWTSARLPENLEERTKILIAAKYALTKRLESAGVI